MVNFIKHGHNLYLSVTNTCSIISMKIKTWFENWSRFRVVHLLGDRSITEVITNFGHLDFCHFVIGKKDIIKWLA